MKMKNLIIVLLTLMAANSFAQNKVKFELETGASISNLLTQIEYKEFSNTVGADPMLDIKMGKYAAARFYFPINRRIAIFSDVQISKSDILVLPTNDFVPYAETKNYIDLTLGVSFNLYKNIFLMASPSISKEIKLDGSEFAQARTNIVGVKYGVMYGIGKRFFVKSTFHSAFGLKNQNYANTNKRINGAVQLGVGSMIF